MVWSDSATDLNTKRNEQENSAAKLEALDLWPSHDGLIMFHPNSLRSLHLYVDVRYSFTLTIHDTQKLTH